MIGKSILVLSPHPDDEAVGACIAIKKAREAGAEVTVLHLTNGIPSRDTLWFWDRSKHDAFIDVRLKEAEKVRKELDFSMVLNPRVATRKLKENIESAYQLIRGIISHHDCDTLWTPAYEGGHQDHDTCNFLASKFCVFTDVWEFSEYNFFNSKINSNNFIHKTGSEICIKLSDNEKVFKKKILNIYQSEQKNLNYIKFEQESFRPIKGYDYSKAPHLSPLFYQRFQWVPWHPRVDYCIPSDLITKWRVWENFHNDRNSAGN